MNTLTLRRPSWLALLLGWLKRPAAAPSRHQAKPMVRIAGLR